MALRPHRHFNFVGLWKKGFILSTILIVLAIAGLITSLVVTGSALTLGTEFSGGTSIQMHNTGDITEDQVKEAFEKAASEANINSEISSLQTSSSQNTGNGFIIKTADSVATDANTIMDKVVETLDLSSDDVQIDTISSSWGASVIWSSILAFILSCAAILIVIACRYRDPRMGVVALITLFHDLIIIIGVYAWAGMFFNLEITSDVIAALLAIIGYSLYDTIVIFHRINKNASPNMRCSLKTCANQSVNEVIMRSMNTSITSILPVLLILILGTDTLYDFAFAMFIGMVLGFYSTIAISSPVYTLWKTRNPVYAKLEKKYDYEVVQSPYTIEMLKADRIKDKEVAKQEKVKAKEEKLLAKKEADEAKRKLADEKGKTSKADEGSKDNNKESEPLNSEAQDDKKDEAEDAPVDAEPKDEKADAAADEKVDVATSDKTDVAADDKGAA